MEYVNIKLTHDELTYVIDILQEKLERSEPSEGLDVLDIINVLSEQSKPLEA